VHGQFINTDEHGKCTAVHGYHSALCKDHAQPFTDSSRPRYTHQKDSCVNSSYSDPGSNVYASVSGQVNAYRDQAPTDEFVSEPKGVAGSPKGKRRPA
jgi:hypothetical protein